MGSTASTHTGTITVRQLLGHTSGLPDYFLGKPKGGVSYAEQIMTGDVSYTISDVADRVQDMTPFFPPQDPSAKRQRACYSDTNYQLLGAIVEAVTGSAFHQVVDEQILRPLDLSATEFAGHPRRRTAEVPATMWAGKTPLDIPLATAGPGAVVMNGRIAEGAYLGSRVHEEGQLYDAAGSCFAGTIQVMPASG